MPTTLKIIQLDGGVVTSRDPSLLKNGELTAGSNIEYTPASPAVTPLNGRTSFGTPALAPVGLYYADFDASTARVVARTTTAWESAPSGETGTFTTLVSGLAAATYGDGAHYLNQHFLYDGVAANRVLISSNTVIAHGLAPITTNVVISTATGSGLTDGSTYFVWATETDATNGIEGTFSLPATGTVTSAKLTAPNLNILITSPTKINTSATGYYVYATIKDGSFPTGYRFGPTNFGTDFRLTQEPGTAPNNVAFDFIQVGGVTYGRNGQPGTARAMEVFEDSLVMIDIATDRVTYSESDLPHYFPAAYFVGFETAFQDQPRALRLIGNSLLVFLKTQVWRFDYLPRATDSEFIRGRVKEVVSSWHGCLSPRGPVAFEVYGGQQLVAFPSYAGWMVTDGYETDTLTDDIDWAGTVSQTALNTAICKNNATKYRLELYFNSGTTRHKRLDAYYHPTKIKEGGKFGKLTITGPHDVPGLGSAVGFLSTNELVEYTTDGTKVYLENRGNTDAASLGGSSTITGSLKTPRLYYEGVGAEFRVERVFVHHPPSSGSLTLTGFAYRDADRAVLPKTLSNLALSDSGATPVEVQDSVQDWQLLATGTGNWGGVNYLVAEITPMGRLEGG